MEKSKSTKTTIKKSTSPRQSERTQESRARVAHKKTGGSLDSGPNKPKQ